jgi:hypothetical protein
MTAYSDFVRKLADEKKITYREATKLAKLSYVKPMKEKSPDTSPSVVEPVKTEEVKVEVPVVMESVVIEEPAKKSIRKKRTAPTL